ncbi:MAG: AMP-dependent synthetase and ligase [Caulobacteraceae bacterium]|nr:MAG: AMP-dependent synthetase and ligase [Caulobacteraceae bacterium]
MMDLSTVRGLADVARLQARTYGDKTALVFEGRRTSFADVDRAASRVGQRLRQEWVGAQERVAILAKNNDLFFEIWFGAMKARACLAPVNFRLAAPEIAYILNDAKAKVLFVGAEFFDLAEKALADVKDKPVVVSLDGQHGGWPDYRAWRDRAEAVDPNMDAIADDDIVQLYTSGTTGNPKGVQLTNANYLAFLSMSKDVAGFDYKDNETVLGAMPLFHVGGTNPVLAGYASGSTLAILRDISPAGLLDLIAREKINHGFIVPAVILMLLNAPEIEGADLSSLKTISYGASPIAQDVLERAQKRFGCDFLQFYGMTETVGAGTYLPAAAHDPAKGKLRSCGIPWPGVEVRVVDANDNEVPLGEVGEIVIKAPIVMKGYFNKPDATAEAVRDGWMHTGDAAYMDADGYFFIYDRVKDMIVTGAENVYPAEVENAVFGHPSVADVAVIGVPDDKWGEAVKAVVVLKPGASPDAESIIAYARDKVAAFKVPKSIDFVEAIPRNASGKVLRRELRKPYWEGRERMVG